MDIRFKHTEQMKIIELRKYLQENDLPSDSYSLEGGLPSEALCIERTKNNWRVYYSERGKKNEFGIFANEEDAVKCFLAHFK